MWCFYSICFDQIVTFVGPFCWYFIIIMFHGDLMGFKRNPAVLNWNGTHVISIHIRVTIQCSVESSLPTLNFWQGLCELESWSVLIWHSNIPSISHKIFSNISQANKEKKQWNIKSQYSPTTCPTISPCFAGYIPQTSWKKYHIVCHYVPITVYQSKTVCTPITFPFYSMKNNSFSWFVMSILPEISILILNQIIAQLVVSRISRHWWSRFDHGHWITMVCCLNPSFSSVNPIISPSRFPQRATFFHPLTHGLLGIPHD